MTRMTFALTIVLLTASFLTACGRSDAQKTADALAETAKQTGSNSAECKLFTPAEIAVYIGEPVSGGDNSLGTGCQWVASDESGDAIVTIVPARYHERPTESEGYKPVADVGTAGFVAPYLDGWLAGAIVGSDAIRVSVAGSGASGATALALLKETIRRHAS